MDDCRVKIQALEMWGQDRDFDVKSSRTELEGFERSVVWKDIETHILRRLIVLRDTLEETKPEEVVAIQARADELRAMLSLPALLRESQKSRESENE